MAAPVLSREDIEQIAVRVLSIYTEAYVPERHLCYQVNPEELADVLGLEVDYQIPSPDGSILGVRRTNSMCRCTMMARNAITTSTETPS